MHLSMLVWRGEAEQRLGFDKESPPTMGTFDYRQVPVVETFEFPPIRDAILDWKL